MHIKAKFRDALSHLIVKSPINHYRDRIANKQIIKNVILEDNVLSPSLMSQSTGALMRILATDKENAVSIAKHIEQNQTNLKVKSVHIANKAINYFVQPKQMPLYKSSVVAKLDPKALLKSATSFTRDDYESQLKKEILEEDSSPQRIVIDFSSPNIAKPFHFGHLKSTILGNYLANINKFVGHHVTKLCYVGDWGTQYGLLSLGLEEFGGKLDEELTKSANSALRYLVNIYVKSNELGRKDENFYSEAKKRFFSMDQIESTEQLDRWLKIRQLSLDELKKSYSSIGVEFDVFDYESDYAKISIDLIEQMKEKQLVKQQEDGVIVAQIEKNNRVIDIPVLKSDGSSLYITRDLAAASDRKMKYNFDRMLYVVGANQERHFHCLMQLVKKLGHDWYNKLTHVKMGKVAGMSSRSGNFVLLSDIIEETTRQYIKATSNTLTTKVISNDEKEEVGKQLALSALFVYDMRNQRSRNYEFDWNSVTTEGKRSGIHLQTTFARLCSLLEKAKEAGLEYFEDEDDLNVDAVCCVEATNLLSTLDEIDNILHTSYWSMDPAPLVNHALELCRAINRARRSDRLWVLGEKDEQMARTRLSMFKSAQMQLEILIKLIGLKPLYKV